jgi:spore maturation protein CgeB
MADDGFSPPTRVFEAAGARACLITEAWQGIELCLEMVGQLFTDR